jgi:DNA mismatch repair protein MutL
MVISVLDSELASQIAAGEVVERPASVVKELLENAIDAGARQIFVEILGGGIEQIRVTDDGHGIPAEEVELAFQHHATSKLATQEQLDAIATLGFRGEALPSIAAVSRITLTTRPAQVQAGYQIEKRWGQPVRSGPHASPPGTSVTVADLFGNLPARRKFLKSASAESGRVHDLFSRYALAYPEIRFQLKSGGRTGLSTPGTGKWDEAFLAVYGPEVAGQMLEVAGEAPETGYRIDGFAGAAGLNRANRSYMTLLVNRRWIQSRVLTFALEEAYHGLLPEKRYPLAVLNLTLPFSDVDVNAHPAKREVRFHNEPRVYSLLQKAVRSALIAESPVPRLGGAGLPAGGRWSRGDPPASAGFFRNPFERSQLDWNSSGAGPATKNGGGNPYSAAGGPETYGGPADAAATPRQALPLLRVVGQIKLTYIVAESPDGMYLVDQHAAHERVIFDRLRQQAASNSSQGQPLLQPVSVELTPAQLEVLQSNVTLLASHGFQIEPFGESTYLVRAVPSVLNTGDPARSFTDLLDMVAFEGLMRQQEDALTASLACHSAIRAGKALSEEEMRALLEQLEATDNPHTCPHGRPTLLHFSEYQMEREFGRR